MTIGLAGSIELPRKPVLTNPEVSAAFGWNPQTAMVKVRAGQFPAPFNYDPVTKRCAGRPQWKHAVVQGYLDGHWGRSKHFQRSGMHVVVGEHRPQG